MPCQLTVALSFIAALAVGLIFPIILPPDVLLHLHGIEVSDETRIHVRAAVISTQRMVLALPCLLPPIAVFPLVCGRPLELAGNSGRPSCIGAMELLFDQQALTRRLVHHTNTSGDFLTPLTSAVNTVEDIMASKESDSSLCRTSAVDAPDIGTLLRRCVTAMYDLSEHMRLVVSRLDATQGLLVQVFRDFGWLLKWVSLRRAMEIAHAGVVDSSIHVSIASNATRAAVTELRGRLWQASHSSTHCGQVDIPSSYSVPDVLHHRQARLASAYAILQASYLLGDVIYTLKSLEDDLREAVHDRDLDRRLLHTICPIGLADAWLQAQHRSHDVHVKHLRSVRADAKKLLDRIGRGKEGALTSCDH